MNKENPFEGLGDSSVNEAMERDLIVSFQVVFNSIFKNMLTKITVLKIVGDPLKEGDEIVGRLSDFEHYVFAYLDTTRKALKDDRPFMVEAVGESLERVLNCLREFVSGVITLNHKEIWGKSAYICGEEGRDLAISKGGDENPILKIIKGLPGFPGGPSL